MKKVINYIMLSAIMVTFLPYSALAETTNVGVNITGETSIEVVTTISADITLDLTTGKTTPTYMEIQNNSMVPVSAKITNISTSSEGAPSTFVGASDKDWASLNKSDTKKYVNFNILKEGQNVSAQDILPNTEIELGKVKAAAILGVGADSPIGVLEDDTKIIEKNGEYYTAYRKFYEINANFGYNWESGDKNFTYQIETVYSQADEYVETEYSMPTSMIGVKNLDINFVPDASNNEKTSFRLLLNSSKSTDEMTTQFTNKRFHIIINGIFANQEYIVSESNPIECIGDVSSTNQETLMSYFIEFSIPALESSEEGTTHYLKITVDPLDSNTSFTFIKKVIAYSGEL